MRAWKARRLGWSKSGSKPLICGLNLLLLLRRPHGILVLLMNNMKIQFNLRHICTLLMLTGLGQSGMFGQAIGVEVVVDSFLRPQHPDSG